MGHDRSAQAAAGIDARCSGGATASTGSAGSRTPGRPLPSWGCGRLESERRDLVWAARGLWLKAADGAEGQRIVQAPAASEDGAESALEREARALELFGSLRPAAAAELLGRRERTRRRRPLERSQGLPEAETPASSTVWLATALRLAIEADMTGEETLDVARVREAVARRSADCARPDAGGRISRRRSASSA